MVSSLALGPDRLVETDENWRRAADLLSTAGITVGVLAVGFGLFSPMFTGALDTGWPAVSSAKT